MKKTLYILCSGLIFLMAYNIASAQNEITPHQILQTTAKNILSAMEEYKSGNTENLAPALNKALSEVVDFNSFAKAVMGRYAKKASTEQKQLFTTTLQSSMISLYSKILANFEISSMEIQQLAPNQTFKGSVGMKVTAANGDIYNITYSVRQNKQGQWKVRNVILDGINLGLTYRNQFNSTALSNEGNIDHVIKTWGNEMKSTSNTAS